MEHGKLGHCEKLNTENIPPLKMVKHVVSDRSLFFLEQNCLFNKMGGGGKLCLRGCEFENTCNVPIMPDTRKILPYFNDFPMFLIIINFIAVDI